MQFRNKRGTPVDPIPFLIVAILGFTIIFSFGPPYLLTIGFSLHAALVTCLVVVCITTAVAYHRYVWARRPTTDGEIPGPRRFERLIYAMLAGFLVVLLLALPFLSGLR